MTNEMEYVLKEMHKIRDEITAQTTIQKAQFFEALSMNSLLPESDRIQYLNQALMLSQNINKDSNLNNTNNEGYDTLSTKGIF